MYQWILAHPTISTLAAYYVLSAFIGALPAPTVTSTKFYQFFYKFTNTLGGNLTRAFATRLEGSPNFQDALNLQKTNGAIKPSQELPKP